MTNKEFIEWIRKDKNNKFEFFMSKRSCSREDAQFEILLRILEILSKDEEMTDYQFLGRLALLGFKEELEESKK